MSTTPTRAYLNARLVEEFRKRDATQAEIDRLNEQLMRTPEFQWGSDDDYPIETILMWRQTFGPRSRRANEYTFVAIKTSRNKWRVREGYMSWDILVSEYFERADDHNVWKASKFDKI